MKGAGLLQIATLDLIEAIESFVILVMETKDGLLESAVTALKDKAKSLPKYQAHVNRVLGALSRNTEKSKPETRRILFQLFGATGQADKSLRGRIIAKCISSARPANVVDLLLGCGGYRA